MSTPAIFRLKKLRNLEKSREGDAVDSSSISRLPDEIILQIFSRLSDLKTLCICYLVSKHFSSIVLEVDAISFTAPRLNPPIVINSDGDVAPRTPIPPILSSFYGEAFLSATKFLLKFRGVKSFCIELPSSSHTAVANRCLFKWKIKFDRRVQSVIFLSPNSVCNNDICTQNFMISLEYLKDVTAWLKVLLWFIMVLPMLEKVTITDSEKLGRLSLRGKKLNEVKEWAHSATETVLIRVEIPHIWNNCYIPVLKLPISGCVMKGIFYAVIEMKDFQNGYDFLKKSENGFEDKEDVAYNEATMLHTHNPVGALL